MALKLQVSRNYDVDRFPYIYIPCWKTEEVDSKIGKAVSLGTLYSSCVVADLKMANYLALLAVFCLVAFAASQPLYETHDIPRPVYTPQFTETVRQTETVTHTFRVTTTSDIWVTESTQVEIPVTVYTTDRNYVPDSPRTVTSVLTVTSTPVFVKTADEFINPARTFVSIYTSFVTTTEVIEFWQSIIHTSTHHAVQTEPVWTTQELIQHVTRTTTAYRTQHVTSTTRGYGPY